MRERQKARRVTGANASVTELHNAICRKIWPEKYAEAVKAKERAKKGSNQ